MTYAQENGSGQMATAPLPAGAPTMIAGGLTGETAIEWLTAWGYNAELATGAEGSPRIRIALNGANFDIAFFTGSEQADGSYESLQLIALFELDGPIGLDKINDWNTEKRFGTAALIEPDKVFVKMDIQLDGLSPLALKDNLVLWQAVMVEFMRFFSA